ncbi:hypothetical protein L2E82_15963 [Cichorium intybus]|uniref:Uncharacterized protein n=1 Tax=Cichorium intybus TaxID=13427 RepID=A0ACB9F478_CICIN|nr:hypothetical protein L2E82_15963 [Cichorium intybus]
MGNWLKQFTVWIIHNLDSSLVFVAFQDLLCLKNLKDDCSWLTAHLEEKTKALELLRGENQELRTQYEDMRAKANNVEAENKTLIDRCNFQKMKDYERLNEVQIHVTSRVVLISAMSSFCNSHYLFHQVNASYKGILNKFKASALQKLARQQVDGVVRQSDPGAEHYIETTIPKTCTHRREYRGSNFMLFNDGCHEYYDSSKLKILMVLF